jgi:AmmeMemoRadiSam system protein B
MALLFDTLWGGEETLIVVSSDLSHYLPYGTAQARDGDTARTILALEATLDPEEACGAHPINGLLRAARRRGMRCEMVDLRNSGDTAGDRHRVVGYGAFAFTEPAHG